ncbi:hypothetical protein B0T16DRAFT_411013 [Cercophora newfieldiana]|uniref:VWFA domain-containing protein n=1 Tax=Cercophora newfieldiana TaxID=92897 RepID=A0AA39YFC2_9PEZI|nr:hypothetical protein B0T16DRAFT_411013 [Cercophora newfieldiana]
MNFRQMPASLRRLCFLSLPALTASFGTVNEPNVLGQHNEHEMVTRLAFQCSGDKSDGTCFERRSLDQLAGYHLDFMGIPITGGGFNGAVGAPDTLDPVPEGPDAHCDDADFLDIPGYPQNRSSATAALQRCVDHLRARFHQAMFSAEQLLDDTGAVRPDMVDLSNPFGGNCVFAFPTLQNPESGRAKCNVIEGLGRALHGVQDFYAHSNWVDKTDPNQPISDVNPPGLARTDRAAFVVDLGATGPIPSDQIPHNLSTGCFVLADKTPGEGDCAGRITHHTLTKDHGIIHLNGTVGEAGPDTPRTEAVPENFQLAVEAAVEASRDLWANFRAELRKKYGPVHGDIMTCSLVRDDPARTCHNHALAIALDKSAASIDRRVDEVGLAIAQALTSGLKFDGADKMTVVEFDETTQVNAPWTGPPVSKHEVDQIHIPDNQPNIGGGLALGIDEVMNAFPDSYTDKGAVVVLTSGFVRHEYAADTLLQLQRAASKGIRVHYGCINMPPLTETDVLLQKQWLECAPGDGVIPAVLKTGGTFSFISQEQDINSPLRFATHVLEYGLTAVDHVDEQAPTRLHPGVTPAVMLSPTHTTQRFSYTIDAGESVTFNAMDRFQDAQGAWGCYTLALTSNTTQEDIAKEVRCSDTERAALSVPFTAALPMELMLVVEYLNPPDNHQDESSDEIILTLEMQSDQARDEDAEQNGVLSMDTADKADKLTSDGGPTSAASLTEVSSSTSVSTGEEGAEYRHHDIR